MDNLLESNERTLVMFDAVCSGLSACLALVHTDIKQMTEHRNKLVQLEQQQIQAKLIPAQELAVANPNSHLVTSENIKPNKRNKIKTQAHHSDSCSKTRNNNTDQDERNNAVVGANGADDDDDPHHLAGLKLLDKRLADSFSHALSLNDLRKSSIAAKRQAQHSRPSIFQVLLGKYSSGKTSSSASGTSGKTNGKIDPKMQIIDEKLDNKLVIDDINRQTRLAMQYSKQLEAHLFKVEDLRAKYEMHLKMGLVVKSVSRAYLANGSSSSTTAINTPGTLARRNHLCNSLVINDSSSLGTHSSMSSLNLSTWSSSRSKAANKRRSSAATSSRTTIKEFIENIDKIESEFESYMGSFLLAIEDLQGFARVCLGDVFEISIKYGDAQKFKTKISVLKDNRQKCDNRQTVFKARIADILAIKAYECKGLGKRTLLGHKLCETRDLFTARSQLMTISLNQTGSIKLNLIVTWNPLHMAASASSAAPNVDISHISLPPTPVSSSTLSSRSSVPSLNGTTTTTINIQSQHRKMNSIKNNNNGSFTNSTVSSQHQHQHQNHHHQPQQESFYQTVDPTYGYYIPPPDYLTNELKYRGS